jgi:hypothetical protein
VTLELQAGRVKTASLHGLQVEHGARGLEAHIVLDV